MIWDAIGMMIGIALISLIKQVKAILKLISQTVKTCSKRRWIKIDICLPELSSLCHKRSPMNYGLRTRLPHALMPHFRNENENPNWHACCCDKWQFESNSCCCCKCIKQAVSNWEHKSGEVSVSLDLASVWGMPHACAIFVAVSVTAFVIDGDNLNHCTCGMRPTNVQHGTKHKCSSVRAPLNKVAHARTHTHRQKATWPCAEAMCLISATAATQATTHKCLFQLYTLHLPHAFTRCRIAGAAVWRLRKCHCHFAFIFFLFSPQLRVVTTACADFFFYIFIYLRATQISWLLPVTIAAAVNSISHGARSRQCNCHLVLVEMCSLL